jgi:TPR repeat protein
MTRFEKVRDSLVALKRQGKPYQTPKSLNLLNELHCQGDLRATYAIGTWYLHGSAVTPRNIVKALKMIRAAAKGGVADAAFDLAICYEKGAGVQKSLMRAFEWYVRAALLGDMQATYEVGRMYFYGLGVPRNRRLSSFWLEKAESAPTMQRRRESY